MPNDIIYILKDDIETEELKYSLRSVEKNFPHNRVWFVGGQPKGLTPDIALPHKQVGNNKWNLIKSSMFRAIEDPRLTEEFFLFNDDFFVMRPFEGTFVNFVDGTLERRIDELHSSVGLNPYTRTLYKMEQELKALHYPTMNYDVHLPMLLEKSKVGVVNRCSSPQMRSAYGNINRVPYIVRPDVKVYDLESVPEDADFLSTNDKTFQDGKVGEYIREQFRTKSRFEV